MTEQFDHAVTLLRRFIQFDTTNPPGNEEEAVLFLEDLVKAPGVETKVFAPVAGRANLYARIKGRHSGSPVVLLSHVDVVPARSSEWTVDPFGGELKDGFIYGRGAIDMKAQAICQLVAFLDVARQGVTPREDLVLLATCDEEVGGEYGVKHVLDRVPSLRKASFVLSEGGCVMEEGGFVHAQVSVAEKNLSQFFIRATGRGGHGSMPHGDSANEKVVGAANRILSHQWPFKRTAIVDAYLSGILTDRRYKKLGFTTLREALKKKAFLDFAAADPVFNALLRNTVTLTILRGGEKVNVIPTESEASFDARLIPGEDQRRFMKKIERLAGKEVEVVPIGSVRKDPPPSGFNTAEFRGIAVATKGLFGPVPVLPFVTTGATDLRYFRQLGITAYGFFPVKLSSEELFRMHGVDERISLDAFRQGLAGTSEIVRFLTLPQ